MGNIIVEECKKRGLELNAQNMGKIATILRYEEGDHIIAKRSIPKIKELVKENPPLLIIDGVRSFTELAVLREEFPELVLIAIITPISERKERVLARKRVDAGTIGDFEEREQRELRFGLGDVISKADYYILNQKISKQEFVEKITTFLSELLKN